MTRVQKTRVLTSPHMPSHSEGKISYVLCDWRLKKHYDWPMYQEHPYLQIQNQEHDYKGSIYIHKITFISLYTYVVCHNVSASMATYITSNVSSLKHAVSCIITELLYCLSFPSFRERLKSRNSAWGIFLMTQYQVTYYSCNIGLKLIAWPSWSHLMQYGT